MTDVYVMTDEYGITFHGSLEAARNNTCTMPLCVLQIGHNGPHSMSTTYARPDLPAPTIEEDAKMMKYFNKVSGLDKMKPTTYTSGVQHDM